MLVAEGLRPADLIQELLLLRQVIYCVLESRASLQGCCPGGFSALHAFECTCPRPPACPVQCGIFELAHAAFSSCAINQPAASPSSSHMPFGAQNLLNVRALTSVPPRCCALSNFDMQAAPARPGGLQR